MQALVHSGRRQGRLVGARVQAVALIVITGRPLIDTAKIETLIRERKLTSEGRDPRTVTEIKEKMDRAEARRLQPHYIRGFFESAFTRLGGQIRRREAGRFEITRVPGRVRDRASGVIPIAERYERICFDKTYRDSAKPQVALVMPGHPLLDATIAATLEDCGAVLKQGTILVNEAEAFDPKPQVLVTLEHAIRDGRPGRRSAEHRLAEDAVRDD
ncbi:MAG TPA: hypothetical protein VGL12_00995 [Roseiarcus sp.]